MLDGGDYVSPDNVLRFRVAVGGASLGFGYPWHTHADILSAVSGLPEAEAVEQYVRDVLEDRAVIAVSRIDGVIADVWVTDDPGRENRHAVPGERVELRYWSGRPWGGPLES